MNIFRLTVIALTLFVILAGCSRSPRGTFYTLAPVAKTGDAILAQAGPTVAIAPVTLPELVDRPQLVVRVDDSRVDLLETHRWAEPLKSAIPRLLAENLSRLLGSSHVSTYLQNASRDADYRVFVDFQRFESTPDSVTVDALWTIRRSAEGPVQKGHSEIHEPHGAGYEAVVAAYSRALAAISSDIARSIRTEKPSVP